MKNGFTLIELAIVLVIIGLLISGVLMGQELVFQAKIRNAATQIERYKLAIETFRTKYGQLPGDFNKAKTFWPNCKEDVWPKLCNGNGNGKLGDQGSEAYMMWRHLTLSGILQGDYNINNDPGGEDLPSFGLPNSYVQVILGQYVEPSSTNKYISGNVLSFVYEEVPGGEIVSDCNSVRSLDEKMDDGKYDSGMMRTYENYADECADTVGGAGDYLIDVTGIAEFNVKF